MSILAMLHEYFLKKNETAKSLTVGNLFLALCSVVYYT